MDKSYKVVTPSSNDAAKSVKHTTLQSSDFVMIKQSRETNKFLEITDKNVDVDSITGVAKMRNKRGDMTVNVPLAGLQELKLDPGTHMFFTYLLYELTKAPCSAEEICVPFNDYMKARGLKDKKSALEAACKYMAVLKGASFSLQTDDSYKFINIADSGSVNSKTIFFKPTSTFLKSLGKLKPLPTIWGFFKINPHKNPYSVYLLHKLLELKRENGDRIVSVKSLTDGMNNLPTKEEESCGSRHVTRNIIEPFERDLDALSWCLAWEYCGEKETEAPKDVSSNFSSFINSYIKVRWLSYPDHTQYIKARARHAKSPPLKKEKNNTEQ